MNRKEMRLWKGLVAGLIAAAIVVAAPTRQALAQGAPLTPVKIGVIGILAEAGMYTAAEKGYFKDEGLDVQFQRGAFGPDGFAALATGQLDGMGGAFGLETVNAVKRGVNVKLVASLNNYIPGWDAGYLTVRKELIDSGRVKDWSDLKGLKVALSAPSPNVTDYFADHYLALGKLTLKDVQEVNVPFDQMITALKTGGADVAHTSEPQTTIIADSGAAVKWRPVSSYAPPGLSIAILHFGPSIVEKAPEIGNRFMTAYLRGARYYDEQVKNRANRDEIAAILTKYTPVKNRELYDRITFPYAPPDGAITMSGLADMAKYFASHGGSDVGDVKKIVDDRFRAAAVAKLGPESK
jgi:NitT/TauT family transport system substrate-binding protein